MLTVITTLLAPFWEWIALALGAIAVLFGYGVVKKGQGKDEQRREAVENANKQKEKGREAVQDLRGATRDERVKRLRKNRTRW